MTLLHERRANYAPRPVAVVATTCDVREAICRAIKLILSATQDQIDDIREYWETTPQCIDRLLKLARICPYTVLTLMGAE